jgi:hypothetical protein
MTWISQSGAYLKNAKWKAALKLADLEAKQAKEDLELFPPTCPKPDPVPELYVEIMQELAKFQVERSSVDPAVFKISPADHVSTPETNGETSYDSTSACNKGPMAKNPLGARGVEPIYGVHEVLWSS